MQGLSAISSSLHWLQPKTTPLQRSIDLIPPCPAVYNKPTSSIQMYKINVLNFQASAGTSPLQHMAYSTSAFLSVCLSFRLSSSSKSGQPLSHAGHSNVHYRVKLCRAKGLWTVRVYTALAETVHWLIQETNNRKTFKTYGLLRVIFIKKLVCCRVRL